MFVFKAFQSQPATIEVPVTTSHMDESNYAQGIGIGIGMHAFSFKTIKNIISRF